MILVVAEHDHAALKSATLNTVAAAQKIGGDVHLLVAGHDAAQTAENLAALVVALAAPYTHILLPATGFGKNAAPRIAALLDVAQISDIVAVESADTFVRPIYAGNAFATVQSKDAKKVITVRTTG